MLAIPLALSRARPFTGVLYGTLSPQLGNSRGTAMRCFPFSINFLCCRFAVSRFHGASGPASGSWPGSDPVRGRAGSAPARARLPPGLPRPRLPSRPRPPTRHRLPSRAPRHQPVRDTAPEPRLPKPRPGKARTPDIFARCRPGRGISGTPGIYQGRCARPRLWRCVLGGRGTRKGRDFQGL